MKHKCVVNACGARGQWQWYRGIAYCNQHRRVLLERHGRSYAYPHLVDDHLLGRVEEGRKVGKPRSWREARRAKEF